MKRSIIALALGALFFTTMLGLHDVIASSTEFSGTYASFWLSGAKDVVVKVDSAGGRHAAVVEWIGDGVFYGYCSTNCGKAENWLFTEVYSSHVAYGYEPNQVQLELDSANRPRLAFKVNRTSIASDGYFYAECNTSCTNASNWQTVRFANAGGVTFGESDWFKLDSQGRPRAVTQFGTFVDYLLNGNITLYYYLCDDSCLNPTSWSSVAVVTLTNLDIFTIITTSLDLTSTGYPRFGLVLNKNSQTDYPYYFECNTACEILSNWTWVYLPNQWSSSFQLALDSQDRVRVATYAAGTVGYISCDGTCLNASSWNTYKIPNLPAGSGVGIGFIFDDQDRPHMAYTVSQPSAGARLDYLYCASGCDSPSTADWRWAQMEEASSFPDAPWYSSKCTVRKWMLNGPVSLALDAKYQPIFGYEAGNIQGWYCIDPELSVGVALRKGRIGQLEISQAPSAPVLSSISNEDADGNYVISWSAVPDATSYTLEEDDNPGFSSPTIRYTGTNVQFAITAQIAGTWYYQVRASNAVGDSSWSNQELVTVAAIASPTPTVTLSRTPTATPTVVMPTPTATPTVVMPTPTATPTVVMPTPTATPTATPMSKPTATPVSKPTATPVPTLTTTAIPSTPTGTVPPTGTISPTSTTIRATVTPTAIPANVDVHIGQNYQVTGNDLTLTITMGNNGPDDLVGAIVDDPLPEPAPGTTWTWTCTATGGANCGTSVTGTGNIKQRIGLLPVNSTVVFTVTGTLNNVQQWSNTPVLILPSGIVNTHDPLPSAPTIGHFQVMLPLIRR